MSPKVLGVHLYFSLAMLEHSAVAVIILPYNNVFQSEPPMRRGPGSGSQEFLV